MNAITIDLDPYAEWLAGEGFSPTTRSQAITDAHTIVHRVKNRSLSPSRQPLPRAAASHRCGAAGDGRVKRMILLDTAELVAVYHGFNRLHAEALDPAVTPKRYQEVLRSMEAAVAGARGHIARLEGRL